MSNILSNIQPFIDACGWSSSQLLIFSENVFSPLVYYSHLLPVLFSLPLALFIFINNRDAIVNRVLFLLVIVFSVWSLSDLILWASDSPSLIMFFWSITILSEPIVYALTLYLVHVFINERDLSRNCKVAISVLILPTILLIHTTYAIQAFDLTNCYREVIEGPLVYFGYLVELIFIIWIVILSFNKVQETKDPRNRLSVSLISLGSILFLLSFSAGNIAGSFSENWTIGQYGLFGMPIFILFILYSIVKFKTFNIKLLSTQALIAIAWLLVFSLLFITDINQIRTIVFITLLAMSVVGVFLVRAVRLEHEQRERIEDLARNLKVANEHLKVLDKQKSEFVSLASHQLRSPLGSIRGYISLISEGEFGKIPEDAKEPLVKVQSALNDLVSLVSDYLDVTRIELGKLEYSFEKINFTDMIEESFNYLKPSVEESGLKFDLQFNKNNRYIIRADRNKIKQVITNIVDNSIKYTPTGSITIILEEVNGKVRFSVKDTGIGLTEESKRSLFQKFTRVDGENNRNIKGTGLGLFIARKIIESHDGKIWVESDGKDKGSSFIFELPLSK